MSVLLVGLDPSLTGRVIERLVSQGDEVRILVPPRDDGAVWKNAGAHVASGSFYDDDLIERAATGCRSVVVGGAAIEAIDSIITGLARTGGTRAIVCTSTPPASPRAPGRSGELVTLVTGTRGILRRRPPVELDAIAEAIDAADDLAEAPVGIVDLTTPEGWRKLRLEPPR